MVLDPSVIWSAGARESGCLCPPGLAPSWGVAAGGAHLSALGWAVGTVVGTQVTHSQALWRAGPIGLLPGARHPGVPCVTSPGEVRRGPRLWEMSRHLTQTRGTCATAAPPSHRPHVLQEGSGLVGPPWRVTVRRGGARGHQAPTQERLLGEQPRPPRPVGRAGCYSTHGLVAIVSEVPGGWGVPSGRLPSLPARAGREGRGQ